MSETRDMRTEGVHFPRTILLLVLVFMLTAGNWLGSQIELFAAAALQTDDLNEQYALVTIAPVTGDGDIAAKQRAQRRILALVMELNEEDLFRASVLINNLMSERSGSDFVVPVRQFTHFYKDRNLVALLDRHRHKDILVQLQELASVNDSVRFLELEPYQENSELKALLGITAEAQADEESQETQEEVSVDDEAVAITSEVQEESDPIATLNVVPSKVAPGESFSISGSNFESHEFITILGLPAELESNIGTAEADSSGSFLLYAMLPTGTKEKTLTLTAKGGSSDLQAESTLTILPDTLPQFAGEGEEAPSLIDTVRQPQFDDSSSCLSFGQLPPLDLILSKSQPNAIVIRLPVNDNCEDSSPALMAVQAEPWIEPLEDIYIDQDSGDVIALFAPFGDGNYETEIQVLHLDEVDPITTKAAVSVTDRRFARPPFYYIDWEDYWEWSVDGEKLGSCTGQQHTENVEVISGRYGRVVANRSWECTDGEKGGDDWEETIDLFTGIQLSSTCRDCVPLACQPGEGTYATTVLGQTINACETEVTLPRDLEDGWVYHRTHQNLIDDATGLLVHYDLSSIALQNGEDYGDRTVGYMDLVATDVPLGPSPELAISSDTGGGIMLPAERELKRSVDKLDVYWMVSEGGEALIGPAPYVREQYTDGYGHQAIRRVPAPDQTIIPPKVELEAYLKTLQEKEEETKSAWESSGEELQRLYDDLKDVEGAEGDYQRLVDDLASRGEGIVENYSGQDLTIPGARFALSTYMGAHHIKHLYKAVHELAENDGLRFLSVLGIGSILYDEASQFVEVVQNNLEYNDQYLEVLTNMEMLIRTQHEIERVQDILSKLE